MSEQRPAWAPGMVLAQVSLRVILPLLAGMIAGLVADSIGQTAPLYALIGLVGGTLVSILWLRAFIRSSVARMRRDGGDTGAAGPEEHEHTTTERP